MISVILPCFNEKDNIVLLVREIHDFLKGKDHELIVVDDSSIDGTFEAILNENLPYVKCVLRTGKPSLAESILMGIEYSQGNMIVVMDTDFNHRPEDVCVMVENLKYFDCVIASRFVYGGRMDKKWRHLSSWFFNIFARIATRTFITDSLFGFFAIRREVLFLLDHKKIFFGYGDYCIRLTYFLQKKRLNILQIPGILGRRLHGEGNTVFFRTLIKYTREVVKLSLLKHEK